MRRKSRFYVHLFIFVLWIASTGLPVAVGQATPTLGQAAGVPTGDLNGFHLVSGQAGWLWLGDALYWTRDAGVTWQAITPPTGQASIQAVTFLDTTTGWVALVGTDDAGNPTFQIARTGDGGVTWQVVPLALFEPGDVRAAAGAIYLDFIDASTGWMMVKQATRSAFSFGTLFKTLDGGLTWNQMGSTIGDPVYFVNAQVGWVAGGAAGNELYRTTDGGVTWSPKRIPATAGEVVRYQLPSFENLKTGILPVEIGDSMSGTRTEIFLTTDGGDTWTPADKSPAGQTSQLESNALVSTMNGSAWTLLDQSGQDVVSSDKGIQSSAPMAANPYKDQMTGLDMASPSLGWASYSTGDCQPDPAGAGASQPALDCTSQAGLLSTADGGQTWMPVLLPQAGASLASVGTSVLMTGQGFDTCMIPSLSDMQKWFTSSPYRFWNLYFGGDALAGCGVLTSQYVYQLSLQGWKFNPTWVGMQAPCFAYTSPKMSSDPTTAYNQGVSEANDASQQANNLQLAMPGQPAPILYYDLEAYDVTNSTCQKAAKSFMDGWVAGLHAKGYLAGVYATGYALTPLASNPHAPDAIWIAAWMTHPAYSSGATVWGISSLSDGLWTNHQRLHQYAGGHNETWGGVTFDVDDTVADGPGVDLGGGPQATFVSPVDGAWLSLTSVTVTIAGVDPNVQIDHVNFEWHSADWQNGSWSAPVAGTKGINGWSATFNTTSFPDQRGGAFFAWVYGTDGKYSGVGAWNLGVDRSGPTMTSLTTTAMYGDPSFKDFTVHWAATDFSGVASYDVQYRGSPNDSWLDLLPGTTDTQVHVISPVYNQTFYFRARATDLLGNVGAWSNTVSYTVQPMCPVQPDAYETDSDSIAAITTNVIPTDGTPQLHNFDTEGDQDWVGFVAKPYTPYTIQTANVGDSHGAHADTVVYIYAPDGSTLLASNDDYPGLGLASRIDWESTKAGTYYVKVVHFDPNAAGCTTEYTLSVTQTNHWKTYLTSIFR